MLGCPFCAKCKENKFQSTGARNTERKTSQETGPATCGKMLQTSSILAPKMLPKSSQNRSRKAKETQRDTKSRPRGAKSDQERPKSTPRTSKSDFKTILGPFPRSARPGSAVSRSAVKAYPGGFRPGKDLGHTVSSTLSPQAVVGGLTMAPPTPPTTLC